jgi:HSP20 family protein
MPESKTRSEQTERAQHSGGKAVARQERSPRAVQRWEPSASLSFGSPFELMDRMTEEMDRAFDRMFRDFGLSRRSGTSRGLFGPAGREGIWAPRIEAFQHGDRFTVRAELPGLKKDDVQLELTDEALTIRGERRDEHEEEREGYYRTEREYGQFHRTIPLPEGVIGESAQASFRDGVLEITMQAAPSEANRGRRLEIKGESEEGSQKK